MIEVTGRNRLWNGKPLRMSCGQVLLCAMAAEYSESLSKIGSKERHMPLRCLNSALSMAILRAALIRANCKRKVPAIPSTENESEYSC